MLTKVLLFLVNLIRSWMIRRSERKATRIATEWLRRSPDRMLDDIGISRIALFTGAEIRVVAESFPSRKLQITPRGEVQIGLQPTPVDRLSFNQGAQHEPGMALAMAIDDAPDGGHGARLASPDGRDDSDLVLNKRDEPDVRLANGEAERHLNWRQVLEPTSGANP